MATKNSAGVAQTGGNPFLHAVAAISTLAGWCSAAMIVAAVAITCQMIFIRFVLNGSTIWQTEAVIYLAIASTLIGLAYVQRLRGHVNVDLVPLLLPARGRYILCVITLTLSIVMVGVLLFHGYEYWHLTFERNWKSDTVWGVRLWIPYLALPVGFALLMLQLIADLVAVVLKIDKPFGLEDL
ncbi:TRAP-type C4-dicarboxylate transport system permease small subunit [Pacificibacter maritimus]|uniref:TRAP transporter small permease protein n=1 Tax=Pacificibacter maritimus TaxID=762213 RepID=A0A3N4URQ7_9RHOB|nr:TRAP transporter small permease [Pacificibacter maritimus]RPE71355.1 TRAP-type C4-dicarboxylate transport system permease small subunit [Pacificibacter maritimus]